MVTNEYELGLSSKFIVAEGNTDEEARKVISRIYFPSNYTLPVHILLRPHVLDVLRDNVVVLLHITA